MDFLFFTVRRSPWFHGVRWVVHGYSHGAPQVQVPCPGLFDLKARRGAIDGHKKTRRVHEVMKALVYLMHSRTEDKDCLFYYQYYYCILLFLLKKYNQDHWLIHKSLLVVYVHVFRHGFVSCHCVSQWEVKTRKQRKKSMERKIKPMKEEYQKIIEAKQGMIRDTRDPRGLYTYLL